MKEKNTAFEKNMFFEKKVDEVEQTQNNNLVVLSSEYAEILIHIKH